MKTLKTWLAGYSTLCAIGLAAGPARAQAPTLLQVAGDWTPTSGFETPAGLGEASAPGELEVRVANFGASVNVPFRLTKDILLLVGGRYDLLDIQQEGAGALEARQLHAVSTSLMVNYRMTPDWDLTLQVAPRLSGDFVDVGGEHFQASGSALVSYRFSPSLTLGGGLLVGNQFGEPRPLPALRLQWQILDRLRLDALLPAQAALTWQPHERVELGLSATLRGQSFALTSERATSGCGADVATSRLCAERLAYSRGEIGPSVGVRLSSSLWFEARAGLPFLRRYSVFTKGTPQEGRLDPNLVVQAQLSFRLPRS